MKNIKLKFLVFVIINLLVLSGCETFIVDRIQNGLAKQETNHIVQAQAISINNNQSVSGGKLLSEWILAWLVMNLVPRTIQQRRLLHQPQQLSMFR